MNKKINNKIKKIKKKNLKKYHPETLKQMEMAGLTKEEYFYKYDF